MFEPLDKVFFEAMQYTNEEVRAYLQEMKGRIFAMGEAMCHASDDRQRTMLENLRNKYESEYESLEEAYPNCRRT